MYILSFDLGSTNLKCIILKTCMQDKELNISLVGKVRCSNTDFALFFYDILKNYNIDKKNIDKILMTGTGSSFVGDSYDGIEIVKIDEFNAIAYGGLILSKLNVANVVSIGTGTTIVFSDMDKVERIGGTGLGGGTLVGLGKAILGNISSETKEITNFKTLIDMAKSGNRANVDLTIGDINKGSIGNMDKDVTAANFAGIQKKANSNDYISAVVNMILENISLIVKGVANNYPVVYLGTMLNDDYIKNRLIELADYTKVDIRFIENPDYAIAIGAWEYYLLRIGI